MYKCIEYEKNKFENFGWAHMKEVVDDLAWRTLGVFEFHNYFWTHGPITFSHWNQMNI